MAGIYKAKITQFLVNDGFKCVLILAYEDIRKMKQPIFLILTGVMYTFKLFYI